MKTIERRIVKSIFSVLTVFAVSLIFSCSLFISPISEPKDSISNGRFAFNAGFSNSDIFSSDSEDFFSAFPNARSAVPSGFNLATAKYAAVLYKELDGFSDSDFVSGSYNSSDGTVTFEFNVKFKGQSDLIAEIYLFASGATGFQKANALAYAKKTGVTVPASSTSFDAGEFTLLPYPSATKTGSISLKLSVPDGYGVSALAEGRSQSGNEIAVSCESAGSQIYTATSNNVTPDVYEVTFTISKNSIPVYIITETIFVFADMTTDRWTSVNSDTLSVTIEEIYSTFYVRGSDDGGTGWYASNVPGANDIAGKDSNDGSLMKPYATVKKAVDSIKAINDGSTEYTIYVDGKFVTDKEVENKEVVKIEDLPKPVDIKIIGLGSERAVFDANRNKTALIVAKGRDSTNIVTLTLENLKFTRIGTSGDCLGGNGTIFCEYYTNLTLNNCEFTENYVEWGGAVRIGRDCNLTINGGSYKNNYASGNGGVINANATKWVSGVANQGTMSITIKGGAEFSENTSAGQGGAVYLTMGASCTIENAIFENNTASEGGACHIGEGCTLEITGGIFRENTATGNGNAISNYGTLKMSGNVQVAENNGIYLSNGKYVTVTGNLNRATPVAKIKPEKYPADGATLKVLDGDATLVANNCGKFAVAEHDGIYWEIDSSGFLKKIVAIGDVGNIIDSNPNGDLNLNVVLNSQTDLENLAGTLYTKAQSGSSARINLNILEISQLTKIPVLHDMNGDMGMFENCRNIYSIILPSSVTSVAAGTFTGCTNLASVEFRNTSGWQVSGNAVDVSNPTTNATKLKDGGVWNNKELKIQEIVSVDEAKNILSHATAGDSVSVSVNISGDEDLSNIIQALRGTPASDVKLVINGGENLSIGEGNTGAATFEGIDKLIELEITGDIDSIGKNAFTGCSNLTSVKLSGNVETIEDGAFKSCPNLTDVEINNVDTIGNDAFAYCSKLENITLSENLETIGSGAFSGTNALKEITIPASVKQIASGTFSNCINLNKVIFAEPTGWFVTAPGTGFSGGTSIDVHDPKKNADNFKSSSENAWKNWYRLSVCNLAEAKTTLSESTLPIDLVVDVDSVSEASELFAKINSLSTGSIPNPVNTLVLKVKVSDDDALETLAGGTGDTLKVKNLNLIITDCGTVESIGGLFQEHSKLISITVPEGIKTITNSAFYFCTNLESVSLPNSLTTIGADSFASCTKLQSIVIPKNVTQIGMEAFKNCTSLISVNIPRKMQLIEPWAFLNCNSNIEIRFEATSNWYKSTNSSLSDKTSIDFSNIYDTRTFFNSNEYKTGYIYLSHSYSSVENAVTELASATDGENISITVEVENGKLSDLASALKTTHATSVDLVISDNSGITSIGTSFMGCGKIRSIVLPSTIDTIGGSAFQYCEGLVRIEIPSTVTQISSNAFLGCTNLTSATFENGWYCTTEPSDYYNKTGGTPVTSEADFVQKLKNDSYYLYRKIN